VQAPAHCLGIALEVVVRMRFQCPLKDGFVLVDQLLDGVRAGRVWESSRRPRIRFMRLSRRGNSSRCEDWRAATIPVHVIYAPNRYLSAKVRVFIDCAVTLCERHEDLRRS